MVQIRFVDCSHVVQFSYGEYPPTVGEIMFCVRCRMYRYVYSSTATPYVAYCAVGDAAHESPTCYRTYAFATKKKQMRWARSHQHNVILETRV